MGKLWEGRLVGSPEKAIDDFNSSLRFDSRLFRHDIKGSIAHARMLGSKGIITKTEAEDIVCGLEAIQRDVEEGSMSFDMDTEDIHTFIEQALTKRIGDAGKKLHTARSRNDQVALDMRMYLKEEADLIIGLIMKLIEAIICKADTYKSSVMPGYTHLQRAQPITFGHHILAYAMMFKRDIERIADASRRMDEAPIGACALAGTTYAIDRHMEAEALGFAGVSANSVDAVSDRDFCIELAGALAILMMHMSRLSEEIILWTSMEFGFVELDDRHTTGSSIMPQKKNPDIAELVRGKTGRVYGNLVAMLTMMKGLPLAYNKDMQEDKEAMMDSTDTVKACLGVFATMLSAMRVNAKRMSDAAKAGFMNATDLADYLASRGVAFRDAYGIVGRIVTRCIAEGMTLDELPLELYREYSDAFEEGLYDAIELESCIARRISYGGTSIESVESQIALLKEFLKATHLGVSGQPLLR